MANATVVTLPQMVDLALNSPEVGIVNFTVLHSLLHVIVKQLDLVDTNVEFRGSDSERLQSYIANAKPGPLLTLTEYVVGEDGTDKEDKKKTLKGLHGSVEKGKADEQQTEKPGQSDSQNKIIVVESSKDIAGGPTVVVTKHHFDKLEDDVKKLKNKVKELADLPANSALIEVLRAENPETTPVLDMFQILNLTKRLDATEVGMHKLASLMEDLAKKGPLEDMDEFNERAKDFKASFDENDGAIMAKSSLADRLAKLEIAVFGEENVKAVPENIDSKVPIIHKSSFAYRLDQLEEVVFGDGQVNNDAKSIDSIDKGKKPSGGENAEIGPPKVSSPKASKVKDGKKASGKIGASSSSAHEGGKTQLQELSDIKDALEAVVDDVDEIKRLLSGNNDNDNMPPELRLNQLETKFNDLQDELNSLDHMFCRQVEILQKRITDLERDTGELVEKVDLVINTESNQAEGQTVGELYNKILQVQEEITVITETSQKMMEDRDDKQHSLDVMLEQIELLKTIKADREDLEDALADKADACLVNRKVSVEQFDAACEDMTKAIEDSLSKLAQQEELWNQALDELQKEIGNKLDKLELAPLRDYINKKLKGLQDKFKSLTALKKDHEAAGTKSKILRNINCISCDKDVVMRKEVDSSLFPKPYALPPSRNMAPYLAYELDQLRKQQKHIPPKKDLNMFENALQSAKTIRSPDHLCNRYCGGSHTITTPQQRVTRLGHFLEQWGPEITPVNDTMIRGSDGHMYRGREEKSVFPTIGPNSSALPDEIRTMITSTPKAGVTQISGSIGVRAHPSTTSAQGRGDSESLQARKKSSLRSPKSDTLPKVESDTKHSVSAKPEALSKAESDTKPVTTIVEPTEEPPEGEIEPVRRKSRVSDDRRRGSIKGRRSKGSVKYSSRGSLVRTSAEMKPPEDIPEEQPTPPPESLPVVEVKTEHEPPSDAEVENYPDPDPA